jgi:hypothetical protein
MPSSSEDLTFARIISVGKGRKTVILKTTTILDQKGVKHERIQQYGLDSRLTCIPEKPVPISDFTLSYLCHVEHADAEANIVEDAVCVFLVELVDESLFWGETELRGVYRNLVLSVQKKKVQNAGAYCEKGEAY